MRQRRILVVGSSGYLGRAVAMTLGARHEVVPTHNEKPYFSDSVQYRFPDNDLRRIVKENGIESCIFCAEIEKNQGGRKLEDLGSFRRAAEELAQSLGIIRVVYISSDGIFSGLRGLYAESSVPRPATEYGRRLKVVEDAIRTFCPDYCIIRPSYLYGYSLGRLDGRLQRTRSLCQSGQEATYFDDMAKSPLHVMDAAGLISLLALSGSAEVVHLGGPWMRVYDFHREAMAALGITGKISPGRMPTDAGLLRDTSLDVRLCTRLTGFVPKSVTRSLQRYGACF